jgi:flavin reductase (DIM6/NTAB) family NADH-FMN oxidoreductase RutF
MTAAGPDGGPTAQTDEFDRLRRRVLWSLPTGLFVVGSRSGDRRNLMTANWVMQVATVPKLVAVAVESGSLTRTLVEDGGAFSVTVLKRSDRAVVRRFVKPADDVVVDGDGVAVTIQGGSGRWRAVCRCWLPPGPGWPATCGGWSGGTNWPVVRPEVPVTS